jgi:hypothetical protein
MTWWWWYRNVFVCTSPHSPAAVINADEVGFEGEVEVVELKEKEEEGVFGCREGSARVKGLGPA